MNKYNIVDLSEALQQSQASIGASEVHGMICGYICSGRGKKDQEWLESVLTATGIEGVNAEDTVVMLTNIYNEALQKIQNMQFDFNLLLPSDDDNIELRAQALGKWCQGFLYGLGSLGQTVEDIEDADDNEIEKDKKEINDILFHLVEISQLDFEHVDDAEDDEVAYTDLVEYLRMAVLTLFYSVKKIQGGDKGEKVFVQNNKTLH